MEETKIPTRQIQAYLDTHYSVYKPSITFRIAQHSTDIDRILIQHGQSNWAYISAFNPYSKKCAVSQNEKQHQLLIEWINVENYLYFEGAGKDITGAWPAEKSVLILGISKEKATEAGKIFKQNAVIVGHLHEKSRLLLLR